MWVLGTGLSFTDMHGCSESECACEGVTFGIEFNYTT